MRNSTVTYMDTTWGFSQGGSVDDIAAFWDKGFYELVAKRLVDAGAVEPNCAAAKDMIKTAEQLTAAEERAMIDEALEGLEVYTCTACNYVHYLDTSWLEPNDWIEGGCQSCDRKHTVVKGHGQPGE